MAKVKRQVRFFMMVYLYDKGLAEYSRRVRNIWIMGRL